MTDDESPDQPDEDRTGDDAPSEEVEAETGRAAEADADEDVTAAPDADGAATPGEAGADPSATESGDEPAAAESGGEPVAGEAGDDPDPADAGGDPAATESETADAPTPIETESVAAYEPDRPQAAVPDQAPPPQPVEDHEDVAAVETTPEATAPARPQAGRGSGDGEESIPGAHLEPDLVLEQPPTTDEPDYSRYADTEPEAELDAEAAAAGDPTAATEPTDREDPTPEPRAVLDLGADARYRATGKRKTSVARVILRPGNGTYTINGRSLEQFFPRATLQLAARQPLQTTGFEDRMDVVARLHGGGVSAQAGALRHGIARALVEADPALRGELKRHGFLTRDARAKERKKAGLKKARKRPQFSKR